MRAQKAKEEAARADAEEEAKANEPPKPPPECDDARPSHEPPKPLKPSVPPSVPPKSASHLAAVAPMMEGIESSLRVPPREPAPQPPREPAPRPPTEGSCDPVDDDKDAGVLI